MTVEMVPLESHVHTSDPAFKANRQRMEQLVAELRERLARAREGGGAKYLQRHRDQGKLPVRERIDRLLDAGSPFLELSPLAAFGMYDDEAPAAGIVTGIGRVSGREVLIVANDATVKGGTYFPITVKKHVRAQEIALQNRLPCVYLVDSGGAFLPLVKAATGEDVSAEDLGGADVHTRLSGVADYFAEDDDHAIELCRTAVSTLNGVKQLPADMTAPEDPLYDPAEIYGIVNADIRKPYDVH